MGVLLLYAQQSAVCQHPSVKGRGIHVGIIGQTPASEAIVGGSLLVVIGHNLQLSLCYMLCVILAHASRGMFQIVGQPPQHTAPNSSVICT